MTLALERRCCFPDYFVNHAPPEYQYKSIDMDSEGIEKKVFEILNKNNSYYMESKTLISE